jgi:hypothetical protein
MVFDAINRVWVSVALLLGICGTTAKAVCFDKDGVSVDPSKGPVIAGPTEFRNASVVLIGTVVSEKNIPDAKEPDFWSGTLYNLFGSGVQPKRFRTAASRNRNALPSVSRYHGRTLTSNACGNSAKLASPFR